MLGSLNICSIRGGEHETTSLHVGGGRVLEELDQPTCGRRGKMKLRSKLVAGLAALALGAVPTVAGATAPEYAPDKPPKTHQPKGHAYGFYCKGESRKHVKGTPGTPFSACVKAAAQADHNDKLTA